MIHAQSVKKWALKTNKVMCGDEHTDLRTQPYADHK